MENVQIFDTPAFGKIHIVMRHETPWWVLHEVCRAVEIANPRNVSARLDDDEKGVCQMDTLGGKQNVTIINESGLYKLLLRSDKPEAKKFTRWVTHEVLPSIRKHGMYATPLTVEKILNDPDFGIQLLTQYKREMEERAALEAQIKADAPKVVFADAVSVSGSSILIGELAKLLKQNGVENMGQNRLFKWLRSNGYLIRRNGTDYNMPTQRSMEMGLFQIKETAITRSDGHVSVNKTVKVTGKGQQYFINLFLKNTETKITVTAQLSIPETV